MVRYVSSEQFFNEFINGIRRKQMAEFKDRYRTIDVLLLDDVQFFEGKEQILEEFFHTFNSLYENGKHLVISSDRHPKPTPRWTYGSAAGSSGGCSPTSSLPTWRPGWPSFARTPSSLPDRSPPRSCCFIAEKVLDNVRELEGALTRVTAYASLTNEKITLDMARDVLAVPQRRRGPRPITPR